MSAATVVDRLDIEYDDPSHTYSLDGGVVDGVSTVAKVCASADPLIRWAYRIGRDGASESLHELAEERRLRVSQWPDWRELDGRMTRAGRTPWQTRDAAGKRGNAIHDALEELAQHGTVPDPARFPEEEQPHVKALIRWYLDLRPTFDAVEVIVGSREHRYAGRYDIRARITRLRLMAYAERIAHDDVRAAELAFLAEQPEVVLCLVDLKTSKGVYPTEHFPQLDGYELASVGMGYPATDAQYVLCTRPEKGTDRPYQLVRSYAPKGVFLDYLTAYRAKRGIEDRDPVRVARRVREQARDDLRDLLVVKLAEARTSAELAEVVDIPTAECRRHLRALKDAGRVTCKGRQWWAVSPEPEDGDV